MMRRPPRSPLFPYTPLFRSAASMRRAIQQRGVAQIIAATGASQFQFLDALTAAPNIDWSCVEVFHLDEYIGLPVTHPASFRKYLLERLINKTGITRYHFLDGDGDARRSVAEIGRELQREPVDLAFVGIGENGHLGFGDSPADFETDDPYLIVPLDHKCRQQQVNKGWFGRIAEG